MTEYINLELSGNDKGDDQLTERQYLHATTTTAASTSSTTTSTYTITKTATSVVGTAKAENIQINI